MYGHTPEEAIAVACRHWFDEAAIKQSKLMSELLALWQSDKETGRKKQRPKSLKTIKDFVKSFTAYFGQYRIKEVNEDLIDAYFWRLFIVFPLSSRLNVPKIFCMICTYN